MAGRQQSLTRRQIEEKITALAWKDDGFRKKFLANPKQQFEERLGIKLPDGLNMIAHQEDESSLHFVIPVKPRVASELSDDDLEKVAGGIDVVITVMAAGMVGVLVSASVTAEKGGWNNSR